MKIFNVQVVITLCVLFLFGCSKNRKEIMIEEFLNDKFVQYAGEAYLQQYEDEDIAMLEKMLQDKIKNPGEGFLQTIEGLGIEQNNAFEIWKNNVYYFKACYDIVLKRCYHEQKHRDGIPAIEVSYIGYALFSDYPVACLNDLEINEYAYSIALNTVKKVPTIAITDKKEINDTTWQVTTNGNKQFMVTFSNLDDDEASVEISCDGKIIAKDIYLNVCDSEGSNEISFEGIDVDNTLVKTKDALEQLGFIGLIPEDTEINGVYWEVYNYTGTYFNIENCEVTIHCMPNDSKSIQGFVIVLDKNEDESSLVNHLSSQYGEFVYQEITSETSTTKRGRYSWIYPKYMINLAEGENCVSVSYTFF